MGRSPIKIFSALWASVWFKNNTPPPPPSFRPKIINCPGSATVVGHSCTQIQSPWLCFWRAYVVLKSLVSLESTTASCKNVETLRRKRSFLLLIAASHRSVRYNTDLLPPVPSKLLLQVLSMVLYCNKATLIRGGGGITSTRSWIGRAKIPYNVSSTFATCCSFFSCSRFQDGDVQRS